MRNNLFLAIMIMAAIVASCNPKPQQKVSEPAAAEYAEYINAYTGGLVNQSATIMVELAQDAAYQPTDGLFSFSPKISGKTIWKSGSLVTFKPDSLVAGQTYKAEFQLGKVLGSTHPGAPQTFSFGFTARKPIVETAEEEEVAAPKDVFRVVSAKLADSRIDLIFSAPPVNANNKGMVELQGVTRSYIQVQDSLVTVYFEGRKETMTLTVDKGVKDAAGNSLGADFSRTYKMEWEKPAVELLVSGNILPGKNLILPFKAVNLSAVEVRIIKIYENNVLMFLQDNDFNGHSDLRRSGRLVYRGDIPLEAENLHQWNNHGLDLSGLFKQEPGAIYSVRLSFRLDQSLYGGKQPMRSTAALDGKPSKADEAEWDKQNPWYWDNYYDWSEYDWKEADNPEKPSYYMDGDRFPGVMLLASDIGLMAGYADGDDLWIAATDLMTARPLGGVSIEVVDYQLQTLATVKTGGDGLAQVKVSHRPFAVVAKAGGSVAYLKLSGERSVSRFDVGGQVLQEGLKAFIYGERGVWRPGDTLHVAAIVQDKGHALPDGHPATLEVYTPEGQFYTKLVRRSLDGFFSFDIPTKDSDPTGYWNAYFKVGNGSFHKTLHIETIKPNRLKITTSLDEEQVLRAGTDLTVSTQARWLAGGVAGNCPASARMTLKKLSGAPFKGFEKYVFTNGANQFSTSESVLYEKKLSAAGELTTTIKLPEAKNAPGMLQALVVTSVQESGGDESFTTVTLPFSPYSSYVGIRIPDGEYLETDKDHNIQVAVLDSDGDRVKDHKIEYAVYKLGWNWWWDNPGTDLDTWISGSSVEKVSGGTFVSGKQDGNIKFRLNYPDWGRFMVLVRDKVSGHVSTAAFTADWPEFRGRADRKDPEAITMLSFSTDKSSYAVGEKATIYIPAAKDAQALVSLENSTGIIDRKWVPTSEAETPYSFTVTSDMAPNFYVNLTLVQPYGASSNDLPLRMYGIKRILVEDPESHLQPVVTLPDVIRPEEKFTVSVSEKNGKPMTYTLAIVDEGLLDLTAFKTPNPWSHMYKPEALGVKTWDMFDNVVGAWSGRFASLASIGGDEEAVVSARKDNRFNPVVLYQGPRTVKSGADKLELQLPMYVGSVRVMVIAGHDGAYGATDATVPVQSPLMVVTTLPRALGSGEQVSVPVNVFAMEDGLKEANVELKVAGPVKIVGGSSQKVKFESTGDKLIHFSLKAQDAEGPAEITVNAKAGGHKTHETISLQVSNPNPEVTDVKRFVLQQGESAAVEAGSMAQLSVFPALDVHAMFADMKKYPYSCSEQLSAKGLTFLHLLPLMSEQDAAEAREIIEKIINSLYARQCSDGGFAYWSGGSSYSWVSSMAGQFLTEASKAGFEVNSGVLSSWKSYQSKTSRAFRLVGNKYFSNLDQAYRLYTQVVAGVDASAAMNRLREASNLGDRASWMLAAAYSLAGKQKVAGTIIDGIGRNFPDYETDELTFGGSFRDRMIALSALALSGRLSDALTLAQESLPERSLSTQESAFAAIAYGHLFEKVPTQTIKAKIHGKEIVSAASFEKVPVSADTAVENLSDGPLYITTSLTSRHSVTNAVSNGLAVAVQYLGEDGNAINPASLQQGTRFRAVIKVTNQAGARSFNNLALSFAIPSGWEIVNDRIIGGEEEGYDYKDIRDLRVDWFFGLPSKRSKTFTVQLRAAYEGTYTLPATVVSAMYDTTVNGNTASGTAVVTR
ncbi:MAG: alpha-2-macroglobulin [Bacteroidales bacterium]|nr:alpha-2-macroglobulin [Bacteroidales bacterium]